MNKIIKISLVAIISFIHAAKVLAQEKPIQIDLSTIKTELKQNAISIGINYVKTLDSLFDKQDILIDNNNSLFQVTPQFNVQTGTSDAFSSINAKITGLFMTFRTTTVADQKTPDPTRGYQTFPISIGIETNNKFNSINGIVEAGWVPWYQAQGNKRTPSWLKSTKFGVFIQGGYKFGVDSTGVNSVGGERDESKEQVDNAIFRAKSSFGINTNALFELSGVGVGLVGNADAWYDFLNSQVYYTVQGKVRFYLTRNKDRFFDFKYQKGSGAPNFNEGDQYGLGLTATF